MSYNNFVESGVELVYVYCSKACKLMGGALSSMVEKPMLQAYCSD